MTYITQCTRCLAWLQVKDIKAHEEGNCIIGLCMINTPHLTRELDEPEDTQQSFEVET